MTTFLMLVGLPGSGKSTYANKLIEAGYKIHSSDAIREELSGDINNQNINSKVFDLLHNRVKEDLLKGYNVIYDATNINWKRRKAFLQELNSIKCKKVCKVIATPFEICLIQNELRDRKVPYDVILRMYKNFDIPYYNEGWDEIELIYNKDEYKTMYGNYLTFLNSTIEFDQDNDHHSLTLGEHCMKCRSYVKEKVNENAKKYPAGIELIIAAGLHDNGKPFTQTYVNKKGEHTERAHYYEHHNVGSYNAMFYQTSFDGEETDFNKLDICALIRWHMLLHFSKDWTEKTKAKYEKEFTENEYLNKIKFYEMLHILYEGDRLAH